MIKFFNKGVVAAVFEDIKEFFENVRFFRPSTELTKLIVERLKRIIQREKPFLIDMVEEIGKMDGLIDEQKTMISEEIFAYLSIKSDSRAAQRKDRIPIDQLFKFGLGKSIGLSNENEDAVLLSHLAAEFSDWIEKEETFPAGWGEIRFAGNGYILLLSESVEIEDEHHPEKVDKIRTRKFKNVEVKSKTVGG